MARNGVNNNSSVCELLKNKCIETIVNNLDFVLTLVDHGDQDKKKLVQRVFGETITKELFSDRDAFGKFRRTLTPIQVRFVLNSYVKKLWLDSDMFRDPNLVIRELKTIGQNIQTLVVSISSWCMTDLSTSVSLLPNLRAMLIHVDKTKSIGHFLEVVRIHCPRLVALTFTTNNKKDCRCNISRVQRNACLDEKLQFLCSIEGGERGRNYALEKLVVVPWMITPRGIAFVLNHFPNLKIFRHDAIDEAMRIIHHHQEKENLPMSTYNFRELTYHSLNHRFNESAFAPLELEYMAKQCPYLEFLKVNLIHEIYGVHQQIVDRLSDFRHLKEFSISLPKNYLSSFFEDMPVLDFTDFFLLSGVNLVKVSISNISIHSIRPLCRYCQSLRKLSLFEVSFDPIAYSEENDDYLSTSLSFLEHIDLCNFDFDLPSNVIELDHLLSCCSAVKVLHIFYGKNMKNFVEIVANRNCLLRLKRLVLFYCDLNADSLKKLIANADVLEEMHVSTPKIIIEQWKCFKNICSQRQCRWISLGEIL